MSRWISVYCQKRIGKITPAKLKELIQKEMPDSSDYYSSLTIKAYKRPLPLPPLFHLNYRIRKASLYKGCPAASLERVHGGVPIVMDQISEPEEVTGRIEEQLEEYLKGRKSKGAKLVREHLARVQEIFSFSMKVAHYADGYGRALAFAAAQALAKEGKGLFREDEFGWLKVTRSGNELVLKA